MSAIDASAFPYLCDTITVQLVQDMAPYMVSQSQKVVLPTNGTVSINLTGISADTSYFIVVRHRNSLETWSGSSMNFQTPQIFDFTTSPLMTFGSNVASLGDGNYAIHGGDIDQNGTVDLLDHSIIETAVNNSAAGYISEDVNGDGLVESTDYSFIENKLFGLSVVSPISGSVSGSITVLDCNNMIVGGTLIDGIESNNVTLSIPYYGSSGGLYGAQLITSYSNPGLTATLPAGYFSGGSGSIVLTLDGTPTGTSGASFFIQAGGQQCYLTVPVSAANFIGITAASCGAGNIMNPGVTYGIVADYDGNTYLTTSVGNQTWMAENLKTSHYANGDQIPVVTVQSSWNTLTYGATCWYDNDSLNNHCPFGKLYNFYTVEDPRNVCPSGWHVPTDSDWNQLITYLDPAADTTATGITSAIAGGLLKSTGYSYWSFPNTSANDMSGFSGLPEGKRNNTTGFEFLGYEGTWWSASAFSTGLAWNVSIVHDSGDMLRSNASKNDGHAVRCLKNQP
jgi:uncharacterized protein (TIGR02145 family)